MQVSQQPRVEDLRLGGVRPAANPRRRPPRPENGEKYLGGPIPLAWLAAAACLSKGAGVLKLSLLLWFEAGLTGKKQVSVPGWLRSEWKMGRFAYYRAANVLEKAGLVSVDRQRGKGKRWLITLKGCPTSGVAQVTNDATDGEVMTIQ